MKEHWIKLTRAQQNQTLILVTAVMLGGYGFWYSGVHKELAKTENLVSRKQNRLEQRASVQPAPKAARASEKDITALRDALEQEEADFRRLMQRFVPLDSQQQQQRLRRELTNLATGMGLKINKLEDVARRAGNAQTAPDFGNYTEVDPRYGRPLLALQAWGSYFGVQSFLDELASLSYVAAPVNFRLLAQEDEDQTPNSRPEAPVLKVEMVLAI